MVSGKNRPEKPGRKQGAGPSGRSSIPPLYGHRQLTSPERQGSSRLDAHPRVGRQLHLRRNDWLGLPCGTVGRGVGHADLGDPLLFSAWVEAGACGRFARCCCYGPRRGAPCRRDPPAASVLPRTRCGTCAPGRSAARRGSRGARTPCTCKWWRPAVGTRVRPSTSSPSTTGQCVAPGVRPGLRGVSLRSPARPSLLRSLEHRCTSRGCGYLYLLHTSEISLSQTIFVFWWVRGPSDPLHPTFVSFLGAPEELKTSITFFFPTSPLLLSEPHPLPCTPTWRAHSWCVGLTGLVIVERTHLRPNTSLYKLPVPSLLC